MQNLLGKTVIITEVCYPYMDGPSESQYKGSVEEVSGHMIKIVGYCISTRSFDRPATATRWFNTMASTFKSIDVE